MAASKRWITVATATEAGWLITAPALVGEAETLLARLRSMADGGAVALGADFPIGLPRDYVHAHPSRAPNFPEFLKDLAKRPDFFEVAETLEQVSAQRPFYPARGLAGMTRASHAAALGLPGAASLSRACDRATQDRPAGAPVFWTLGANQSGKAALHAWKHLLIPALHSGQQVKLWPFAGPFLSLLQPGVVVIAETYPAEALRHLALKLRGSKRRQTDRLALAAPLLAAIAGLDAAADAPLGHEIASGFGSDAAGEDRFDSLLGVLCVLNVLAGRRTDSAPERGDITTWEGWVLGQSYEATRSAGEFIVKH